MLTVNVVTGSNDYIEEVKSVQANYLQKEGEPTRLQGENPHSISLTYPDGTGSIISYPCSLYVMSEGKTVAKYYMTEDDIGVPVEMPSVA